VNPSEAIGEATFGQQWDVVSEIAGSIPETLAKGGAVAPKSAGGRLRLYVAGSTPNSVRAERNLAAALHDIAEDAQGLEHEIIDVLIHAKQAILDGVIVTPTLVGQNAGDRLILIGDLADLAELKRLLRKLNAGAAR
jgi:hypothetical protein